MDKNALKQLSGKIARQKGENIKNKIAIELSFNGHNMSHALTRFCEDLNVKTSDISFTETKSLADNGKCIKPDLSLTIYKDNALSARHNLSVKSTFKSTQLSVHSISSFFKILHSKKIMTSPDMCEVLTHFCYSGKKYINEKYEYVNKPHFIYDENIRRDRFSLDEIESMFPVKFQSFIDHFTHIAVALAFMLISEGDMLDRHKHADIIVFSDNQLQNIHFFDIKKVIDRFHTLAIENNTMLVLGNKKKTSGITTFSFLHGLISVQMKGSGEKDCGDYHNLQFKINGSLIKKIMGI